MTEDRLRQLLYPLLTIIILTNWWQARIVTIRVRHFVSTCLPAYIGLILVRHCTFSLNISPKTIGVHSDFSNGSGRNFK